MDNQHKHIVGYRDLTAEEINLMNEGKDLAEKVGEYISKLEHLTKLQSRTSTDPIITKQWLLQGKDKLQVGFMCVIRSIAKPTTF